MRPPICEVCNERFDPADGALVTCVGDEASAAFDRRAEMPGFVGHAPNKGWFCARHRSQATELAATHTLPGVVSSIRNDGNGSDGAAAATELTEPTLIPLAGRPPVEYDERPPSGDPDRARRPLSAFDPVLDGGLDVVAEHWHRIAPHDPDVVYEAVNAARHDFARAFGVVDLRSDGSSWSATSDPADHRWASEGLWVGSTRSPHHSGEIFLFVIRQSFRELDHEGPMVRQGVRLLIQQREQSMFELTVAPAEPPTVAVDDLVMLERVLVRQRPELDDATADGLRLVVDDLVSQLAIAPANPLELSPDLVGVDLGDGTIVRRNLSEGSSVSWRSGLGYETVVERLIDALPRLLDVLHVDEPIELERSSWRTWDPIDGATPPHCPFTDETTWTGEAGATVVQARSTSAQWDEDRVANRSVGLSITTDDSSPLHLTAHEDTRSALDGTSDRLAVTLSLSRPTNAAVVSAVRSIFDC